MLNGTLARVGWSPMSGSYDIGTDRVTYGYGSTGYKSNNKSFLDYGGAFKIGNLASIKNIANV